MKEPGLLPPYGCFSGYSQEQLDKASRLESFDCADGYPTKDSPEYPAWRQMKIDTNPPGTYLRTILEKEIEHEAH